MEMLKTFVLSKMPGAHERSFCGVLTAAKLLSAGQAR
jgi:hypothetical protein